MSNLDELDKYKSRVLTFISKTFQLNVTLRSDISSDSNIQALNIFESNIDFLIFDVYNERNQKSNSNEYTIERKLILKLSYLQSFYLQSFYLQSFYLQSFYLQPFYLKSSLES
jgi:hypothetical protein